MYYSKALIRVHLCTLILVLKMLYGGNMVTKEELAKVITDNRGQFYGLAYTVTKNKHDAEDALGQAVVISFEKMGDIKKSSKIKEWVSTIVYNEALRIAGARNNIMLLEDADIEELAKEDKNMTPDRIFIWQKI